MKRIDIHWKGADLVIGEAEAFDVGEQIEEIITLPELAAIGERPKMHKLARCYSLMINFAGGTSTPQEVHEAMLAQMKAGDVSEKALIADAVGNLIEILMDGAPDAGDGDAEKKT